MTSLKKRPTVFPGVLQRKTRSSRLILGGKMGKPGGKMVSRKLMDERIEDAQLNAIADERSGGPFVRVTLDDL